MRQQPYCTRTPTTHQLNGGEETEWWSQSVCGDDYKAMMVRWPMGKFWVFTTESQNLGLMSQDGAFYSIVSPSLHWGIRTHTDSKVSNLVFPGGLPSRYWPGSALLIFSGQSDLGCLQGDIISWFLPVCQTQFLWDRWVMCVQMSENVVIEV